MKRADAAPGGISGTGDQFRFAYAMLIGDESITTRVSSQSNINAAAKVVVRDKRGRKKCVLSLVVFFPLLRPLLFLLLATSGQAVDASVLVLESKAMKVSVNGIALESNLAFERLRSEVLKLKPQTETWRDYGYHSMRDNPLIVSMSDDGKMVYLLGARMSDIAVGKVKVTIEGKSLRGDESIEAIIKLFDGEINDLARRKDITSASLGCHQFTLDESGKSVEYVILQIECKLATPATPRTQCSAKLHFADFSVYPPHFTAYVRD